MLGSILSACQRKIFLLFYFSFNANVSFKSHHNTSPFYYKIKSKERGGFSLFYVNRLSKGQKCWMVAAKIIGKHNNEVKQNILLAEILISILTLQSFTYGKSLAIL